MAKQAPSWQPPTPRLIVKRSPTAIRSSAIIGRLKNLPSNGRVSLPLCSISPTGRDLTRYEVLRSTICQESDIVHWVYDEVIAAAQLYGDAAYEVILYRDGYEFADTVILDLAAFAQGDGSHADH